MRVYIDLETCPTTDPETIQAIRANIKPPSNYTKPDSIQQWLDTKGHQAAEEAVGKTALDAALGSIISIAWAVGDESPVCLVREPDSPSDKELIEDFLGHLDRKLRAAAVVNGDERELFRPEPYFIGHHAQFDLGWLYRRCAIHGLRPPFRLPCPATWRPGRDFGCTMQAWCGLRDSISLDRLCKALGIPSPKAPGVDGSMAWKWWQAGDLDAVRNYNLGDVRAVREVWNRLESVEVAA